MNFSPVFPTHGSNPPNAISPAARDAEPTAAYCDFRADREWDPVAGVAVLLRAWRLISGLVLLTVIIAWMVLSFLPKHYTAETVVLLDPRNQPNLQLDEVMAGLAPDDQTISSEVLILQSATLAAKVIAEFNLAADPYHNPTAQSPRGLLAAILPDQVWTRLFRSSGAVTGPAVPPEAQLEVAEVRVLQSFAGNLEVERLGRSHAIRVAFTSHSPEQAADIANRLADRYLEGQLSVKFEAHGVAQDWLTERVTELQGNVETAEQAVEEYRTQSGLIGNNGLTMTNQQMGEINTRLIAARSEAAAARTRLAQVKSLVSREGDALSAAEVLSSPLIHRLKEQEVEVLRRRADLSQEYGPRHPRILSVEAELADVRSRVMSEVRQIVAGLSNEVSVAVAQEQALARDLERLEGKTAEQNQAGVRLRALEREAEASRNLLETFLARIKETSHQEAIQRSDARILSPALPPSKPSAPRELLVLAAAGMASLMLAIVFVLARAARVRGIEDPYIVRERLGLRVLATVPKISLWRRSHGRGEGRYPIEDAAAVLAAASLSRAQTVLVAPVEQGMASAPFVMALCRVFARQESQVLLVDGALDHAALSVQLGLEHALGLADILLAEDAGPLPTVPSGINGMRFLCAGSDSARGRLIMSPSMLDNGLHRVREVCERIVIHGEPMLDTASSRLFAAKADATVLTVRWASTPLSAIAEAAAIVREAGGTVAGIILLDADLKAAPAKRGRRFERRWTGPPLQDGAAPRGYDH